MSKILLSGFLSLSILVPRTALAVCERPATLLELTSSGALAEVAFAQMDAVGFLTNSTLVRTKILPCLAEPLTVQTAAGFHRLMALEAFVNEDETRAIAEFHAARKLDPGYSFSTEVVDLDHPVRVLYETAASVSDGEAEAVYPPLGGFMLVAGVRNAARYKATPVVIQVFGSSGALVETRYVQPGESLPKWSDNPLGLTAADLGIKRSPLKDSRLWYVASGVSAFTGGILYALAMNERSLFEDPITPDADLLGHQESANSLGTASIVAAGTTLVFTGLGVGFQITFGADKPPSAVVLRARPTLSTEAFTNVP
ncbi:MAG: hypothetical protein WC654_04810 [Patescibacteria group bacterium]